MAGQADSRKPLTVTANNNTAINKAIRQSVTSLFQWCNRREIYDRVDRLTKQKTFW